LSLYLAEFSGISHAARTLPSRARPTVQARSLKMLITLLGNLEDFLNILSHTKVHKHLERAGVDQHIQ
jgi:hypothetical protein